MARSGRGSPSMSWSPVNWRWRWCARNYAGLPATAIAEDLRQPVRMLRLLQGDVGSGKTVVGLLAAAAVTEVGKQAALMAPTEILARQHIKTITPLAERAGLRVA